MALGFCIFDRSRDGQITAFIEDLELDGYLNEDRSLTYFGHIELDDYDRDYQWKFEETSATIERVFSEKDKLLLIEEKKDEILHRFLGVWDVTILKTLISNASLKEPLLSKVFMATEQFYGFMERYGDILKDPEKPLTYLDTDWQFTVSELISEYKLLPKE